MNVDSRIIELKWHSTLSMLRLIYGDTFAEDCPELPVIDDMLDIIETRRYTVAVMGAFNRGKSSLINALLGAKVLPADVTPTTATVSRIQFGQSPSLRIALRDGGETTITIPPNADISDLLRERVTKLTEASKTASSVVREAIIGYPTPLCQNNASYIDTPGFEDEADMDAISREALLHSDAVVVVITAQIPYSMTEADCVAELLSLGKIRNLHFVCTHMDMVSADEQARLLDGIRERIAKLTLQKLLQRPNVPCEALELAQKLLAHPLVFGVSSCQALEATVAEDRAALHASGIPRFRRALASSVAEQQQVYVVTYVGGYLCQQMERFERQVELYRARLSKKLDERAEAGKLLREHIQQKDSGLQNRLEQCDLDVALVTPSFEKLDGEARSRCIEALGALKEDTLWALTELLYGQLLAYLKQMDAEAEPMCDRARQSYHKLLIALTEENARLTALCHVAAPETTVTPFDYTQLLPETLSAPKEEPSVTESEIGNRIRANPRYRDEPTSLLAALEKTAFSAFSSKWESILAGLRKSIMQAYRAQNAILGDALAATPPEEKRLLRLLSQEERWKPTLRLWQNECIQHQHAYWQHELCLHGEKGADHSSND